MISKNHSNRRAHNWLVYDIGDRFLEKYVSLYNGSLYDLGSGESPYKEFFLLHAEKYFAVDWSASYHDTAVDIAANLNEPLPLESEVADTVVSLSVLEHLREPQIMLNEACRILKKDCWLVMQVPWQWWVHEAPHDYFRYTPFALKFLLERAGFVNIRIEPQAGLFTTITLKINYWSARFVNGPDIVRIPLKAFLSVFWYIGQKMAPVLDRLDRDWSLEAPGYFVTARKP